MKRGRLLYDKQVVEIATLSFPVIFSALAWHLSKVLMKNTPFFWEEVSNFFERSTISQNFTFLQRSRVK